LVFFAEAKQLFDPLHVEHCPACLQQLIEPPQMVGGQCSMCDQELKPTEEVVFAIERERRALKRRIKDLDGYTERVQQQIADAQVERARLEASVASIAKQLDDRTARDLSPFLGEREQLIVRRAAARAQEADLDRAIRWINALELRKANVAQTKAKIEEVTGTLAVLTANQPDRSIIVGQLSERFATLLRDWGFPKVDDPEPPSIDDHFMPQVRGRVYRAIGSDGALTLIALAWMLSVFELAVESGGHHPGFLMLDSPQKNLAPHPERNADEYMDPAIVAKFYAHVVGWTTAHPDAQIVIVDHEPPQAVAGHEIVRFSRRADMPPYGLIEDQTGER
jgi:hypothetical protein